MDAAAVDAGATAPQELAAEHRRWIEEVALLITDVEREVFLALDEEYQRDDFIAAFWRVRDPYPQTPRNELREEWDQRVAAAREELGELESERARMLLTFGEPSRRKRVSCGDLLHGLEVWTYDGGGGPVRGTFTLVFRGHPKQRHGALWQPFDGLQSLFAPGRAAAATDAERVELIRRSCTRAEELLSDLATSLDLDRAGDLSALLPRPPSEEWVRTYEARSTALAADAAPLDAALRVSYPGRHQSRTVVQGLVEVPSAQLEPVAVGPVRTYNLVLDGEVLRQGELFERFRYRFELPAAELAEGARLPLVLQRYLRPGPYTLVVKVEDTASRRAARRELEIDVPRVARKQPLAVGSDGAVVAATEPAEEAADAGDDDTADGEVTAPRLLADVRDAETRLGEANAAISTGDHTVQILPLPEELTVGRLRVEARLRGEGVDRVAFLLDGKPVLRKRTAPYSVELDLGGTPRVHELRAEAQDATGRVLAADEVLVNAGPHRFAVRLLEPQPGRRYRASVRVHVEVEVPEGERLDRVELYLNETRFATLYQPPFEQPLLLPREETSYVRALAVLDDGASAEDVVFINAPDFVDEVEIDFVELYTSVTDRGGDYVAGLEREDFVVREDGEVQEIRRFEVVEDLPVRAGIVLDTSLSMFDILHEVERAAYQFLEKVISPRDRAALITFADEPHLVVRFTNDKQVLAGGLASLTAEGETALYDSLVFALHYFSGLRGKRALVVLTDGEDSKSGYTYEEAVEYARRTGVAIYVIGIGSGAAHQEARVKMERIARETGGEYYWVDRAAQLASVYERIENELRAQYLLGYQSPAKGEGFRTVEVEVAGRGLTAKTMRGYYP